MKGMALIFIFKTIKMKDKQEFTGRLKMWQDTQIIFIFKTTKMKNMRRRSVEKKEKKKVWQEQARRGNQVEKQRQEIQKGEKQVWRKVTER